MSASAFVQLPYGVIENQPDFKFKNQKNYETNNYLKTLPYLDNVQRPEIQNDAINLIKNKASFRNYLLATSDVGTSLQDAINHIVTDGEFNDVGLRRVLDSHNSDIFKVSNPLSLVFKNAHTYNLKNPVLGNLVSQIYASGLSDENIKNLLFKSDIQNIQTRLDNLRGTGNNYNNKNNNNNNDDDDNDGGNPNVFLPDVPTFEPWDNNGQIDKNIQRENPKQIAPRESISFKTALTKDGKPVTVQNTSFAEPLPQVKVRVKDGLNFDTNFEVDNENFEPKFEKFPDSSEDYQVSFDKPITILKEDGTVEIQPEINFEPDINPIVKDELKNDENPKGYHKFKDIDVSNSLKLFFPKLIEEKPNSEELIDTKPNQVEINDENLMEIVDSGFFSDDISKINETFFIGGNNWSFEKEASRFRNPGNEMFINFLQSNLASELMKQNKIKIHISSGDIYVNNINTNESLYDFLAVQDNENYIMINKEFIFDGSLAEYYNTYLTDNSLSVEDDFTTNRNSKFLYLHFNNVLQMTGVPTYKLRHTVIIKNEKSIELMQKSNWQYFIETLMNHAENSLLYSASEYTDEEQETIRPYIDKLISHGEMYKYIFASIALSFHNLIENLPNEHLKEIYKDLNQNNIYLVNPINETSPEELLNIFLDFYYFSGRFPGDNKLIVLPTFDIPKEINNSIIDFQELFFTFKNSFFQSLTSIQGICALCKYISNEKAVDNLIKNTIEELLNNCLEKNLHYYKGNISYDNVLSLMKSTINNLNNINENINRERLFVSNKINEEINKYENEYKIEEILDPEGSLEPLKKKRKIDTKNEDYVNELNKYLVQVEPGIEGAKQIKNEDTEKLNLDLINPNVKIEDSFISDVESENNLSDISENNLLSDISDNLLTDIEDNLLTDIEDDLLPDNKDNKISLDLDQNYQKNVKLELDNNLNVTIKHEKTETGFLPDLPNKDNLGEQIIQIETNENEAKEINEEIDTNYKRPIVVLPESHLSILRKKQGLDKAKIRKTNLIPEKYSEARTKRQSLDYLKKLRETKDFQESDINFEEFSPNIEKYLKKNRQIDLRKVNIKEDSVPIDMPKRKFKMKKDSVPVDIPKRKTTRKSPKKEEEIDFEDLAPNIEKYLKKNKQIDMRKIKTKKSKAVVPSIVKKREIDYEEFKPNIEKYLKKNRQIDIRKIKKSEVASPIKKKKKSKSKYNIDLEEFAPNLEKYLKKNRKIDLRKFKDV